MRRVVVLSAMVTVLLLFSASAALAYSPVTGCVTTGTAGDPGPAWPYGGTVTAWQTVSKVVVGTGTLDANGCFSVTIGNGPEVQVSIEFNSGPNGTPADICTPVGSKTPTNCQCTVPTDNNYTMVPYACGPIYSGTGPNAVSMLGFGATPSATAPALLGLVTVLGAAVAFLRRR